MATFPTFSFSRSVAARCAALAGVVCLSAAAAAAVESTPTSVPADAPLSALPAGAADKPLEPTLTADPAATAEAAQAAHDTASKPIDQLNDPETELGLTLTELGNLSRRLEAAKEMAHRQGLGPQTESADRSFRNAQQFFNRKEFLSALRELNNYLNQTQVPVLKPYLKAQYMLGRSYEELGMKSRGVRAYFRYLAAFLTSKDQDHAELLDVLKHMIPLAAADKATTSQLNELLASVTTLDLPANVRPAVLYFAAKAAANAGGVTMARSWLEQAVAGPDAGLKARALYMRALLALANKEYEAADEILTNVIQTDKDGETHDLARLALARVAVHRRKPETALKHYNLIEDGSPAFKDATFESVYVHLTLKEDKEARGKAMLYLARHAETPEALQLRMLLAYLDMRAGDLDSATRSISAADQHMTEIDGWIRQRLVGQSTVDQGRLADLLQLSGSQVAAPPTVLAAYQLFGRIAELSRRLADVRGEVRNVTFTLGRADLAQLRPEWVHRADQLSRLGNEVLATGHRLAAVERYLNKPRIDATDWQRLSASEARRTRLLSAPAVAKRRMERWASYAGFLDLTRQTSDAYKKLKDAEADLATSRFLMRTEDRVKGNADRQQRLQEMEARTAKLRETVARTLELVRKRKIEDLLTQSPHRATQRFLAQYATALNDERDILRKTRDDAGGTAARLNAEDASRAWTQWEDVAKETFDQLAALDKEIGAGLAGTLKELEQHETVHDELAAKLKQMTSDLEARLGRSLSGIIDQYADALGTRLSRNKKWKADIEWLGYQSKLTDERKLNERTQLEEQILRDNLSDLQQGALWQWPK